MHLQLCGPGFAVGDLVALGVGIAQGHDRRLARLVFRQRRPDAVAAGVVVDIGRLEVGRGDEAELCVIGEAAVARVRHIALHEHEILPLPQPFRPAHQSGAELHDKEREQHRADHQRETPEHQCNIPPVLEATVRRSDDCDTVHRGTRTTHASGGGGPRPIRPPPSRARRGRGVTGRRSCGPDRRPAMHALDRSDDTHIEFTPPVAQQPARPKSG